MMAPEVVLVHRDEDLGEAERLMARENRSRIIVVDEGGRLCGVISLADIAASEESRRGGNVMREVSAREV